MKIALYLNKILTLTHTPGIWGDEIWANALAKGLREFGEVRIYGDNLGYIPDPYSCDIAVYFQLPDFYLKEGHLLGKQKNLFLMQNFGTTPEDNKKRLEPFFDIIAKDERCQIATISAKYAEDYKWKLFYPAVDHDVFYPRQYDDKFNFDIAYIGNNIKDSKKTVEYLSAPNIKYGVFGNGFDYINWINTFKIFSSSRLNLNFFLKEDLRLLTARIFQIIACRGIIITEYCKEFEDIFKDSIFYVKPGESIQKQLIDAVDFVKDKKNKDVVRHMKDTAQKIVKDKYDCKIQAEEMFKFIMDGE